MNTSYLPFTKWYIQVFFFFFLHPKKYILIVFWLNKISCTLLLIFGPYWLRVVSGLFIWFLPSSSSHTVWNNLTVSPHEVEFVPIAKCFQIMCRTTNLRLRFLFLRVLSLCSVVFSWKLNVIHKWCDVCLTTGLICLISGGFIIYHHAFTWLAHLWVRNASLPFCSFLNKWNSKMWALFFNPNWKRTELKLNSTMIGL